MRGKEKCRMLREIRRQIAEQNDIALVTEECQYKGECRGTCPKCESELRYLEEELDKRRSLGKRVAIAGIAAGTAIAISGCSLIDVVENIIDKADKPKGGDTPVIDQLMGEIDIIEEMGDWPVEIQLNE